MSDSPSSPFSLLSWLLRGAAAVLLLAAYLLAWQPARTALVQSVARPILASVETAPVAGVVEQKSGPRHLRLRVSDAPDDDFTLEAPAGIRFLLPALFVVILAPTRRYWCWLWGGHLVLFALVTGLLVACLYAPPGTFVASAAYRIAHFSQTYLVDVVSLAVPIIAFIRERKGGLKAVFDEP